MESKPQKGNDIKTAEFSTLGFSYPAAPLRIHCKKQNLVDMESSDAQPLVPEAAPLLSYSVKDLSFAMFMDLPLNAKYKNIHVANRNRKIIEFFSRPIA